MVTKYIKKFKKSTSIRVGSHIVGKVQGDTFSKRVRASRHFLRTPPAIALDIQSLDDAESVGAKVVQVEDIESRTIYRATVEHIRQVGFELDRGFGRQVALPINGWIQVRAGEPMQLAMWSEHGYQYR